MLNKTIIFTILFIFMLANLGFTQKSASQVLRSQEILEKEQVLRKKLEEPEKFYIKEIILQGITLLSEEELEQIAAPFQKHWLTKVQIQQLLDLIEKAYEEKGFKDKIAEIAFKVKSKQLIITVEELK